jgi:membrane-anchored protein YejM (alkaline phosphatase superfamily)
MNRQTMWGVMLLTGVSLYLWRSGEAQTIKSSRTLGPNVLLVTLDTTRADAISAQQTPWIYRMASDGTRFTGAVSTAPITQPAHLGILTGEPPHVSGVVTNGTDIGERPSLLSHQLKDAGWATAAFISAAPLTRKFGWEQGWDYFGDTLQRGLLGASRERRGSETVDEALGWLKRHKSERFAVWLHLFDPHGPYTAPGRPIDGPTDGDPLKLPAYWPDAHKAITDTDWFVEGYRAEVAEADFQLGRVLRSLDEWGVLDDTLVVITADHGESLTEHDYLFDHGDHLYDASLRVPLVFRWPGKVAAGAELSCATPTTAVYGAMLGLLGLRSDPLASVLSGAESCVDQAVVATTVSERFADPPPIDHAYRTATAKQVTPAKGEPFCFDLSADPGEENPLSGCPEEGRAALAEALSTGGVVKPPEQDAETEKQLKELGYLE